MSMWLIAIAASAGEPSAVEFRLRAAVSEQCQVRSVRVYGVHVEVNANCNADRLSVKFDAAGARLRAAASTQAVISFTGNEVSVRPYQSGVFTLKVKFDRAVKGVNTEIDIN